MLPKERGTIKLELLAPAKDLECGLAAIDHGADAVYIGAPKFSARKQAGNSLENIKELIRYAHLFGARVYVAINTLLFDDELKEAEQLIWDLYDAGADAVIIQDMGIMQMNLPPIPLHASTQTDNRTWQKVHFLQEAGFQQVVLARELSIENIKEISSKTSVPLEFFIHGALCVSYSGNCYMSEATTGRSANRGECSQPCRLPYDLATASGETIVKNHHLLSLKDLNLSDKLKDLIGAGITSFKIEGRLKDAGYVKNITAHYRKLLDDIVDENPDLGRSSTGKCNPIFIPSPEKSFSRGFSTYFLDGRQKYIWSMHTPKSLGEKIGKVVKVNGDHFIFQGGVDLNNGDGLCFLNRHNELAGFRINTVVGSKVYADNIKGLFAGATLYRNHDQAFDKKVENSSDIRKIGMSLVFSGIPDGVRLELTDEDGYVSEIEKQVILELAQRPDKALEQIKLQLAKWGNTVFVPKSIKIELARSLFIPVSLLNGIRRELAEKHKQLRIEKYIRKEFKIGSTSHAYPCPSLDYSMNVVNENARTFYQQHGVENVVNGYELHKPKGKSRVMTTRHCIRYATDACPVENPNATSENLIMKSGKNRFELKFDCKNCEMQVYVIS